MNSQMHYIMFDVYPIVQSRADVCQSGVKTTQWLSGVMLNNLVQEEDSGFRMNNKVLDKLVEDA